MAGDDVKEFLETIGFDPDECVLTRRQAEVLALRERDVPQREIAERLGTSRANVSSIEASARRNVEKARETVAIADAMAAPVQIQIDAGTDLFEVPEIVYAACDDVDTKVTHTSAALIRRIRQEVPHTLKDQRVTKPIVIGVSNDGTITVQRTTR